ncbi:hypothetical protein [Mesorhizobium wenxiniae]|uniref:Uncharacterized protein n=1 Tax=Mesorhizobium wenxiniae TaxID=2014805 RepID=A0A271KDZ7_9HYPH|nr:hypothetical protein [Mesorhizobium wenxiniae]PAP94012.1 hypothetical protein CIT31_16735 [Mesorhizobium wenxiniae]
MNAHTKPITIATTDGLFTLNQATGHYEPEEPKLELPHPLVFFVLWPLLAGMCWAAFIGLGYGAYRAFEALAA